MVLRTLIVIVWIMQADKSADKVDRHCRVRATR